MSIAILVVIPAYNEGPVIRLVINGVLNKIRKIDSIKGDSEIVVINDGSNDNTYQEACRTGVNVINHLTNCGLGASLGTGLLYARLRRTSIMVTFDGDDQHDPNDIPRLIRPILNGEADVVIGSRMINSMGMPFDRRLINWVANFITLFFFGIFISDTQSGLRAFNRYAIQHIQLKTNRMEVSSEVLSEVKRMNLRLVEIPIKPTYTNYSRKKGQSNLNSISVLIKLFMRMFR